MSTRINTYAPEVSTQQRCVNTSTQQVSTRVNTYATELSTCANTLYFEVLTHASSLGPKAQPTALTLALTLRPLYVTLA